MERIRFFGEIVAMSFKKWVLITLMQMGALWLYSTSAIAGDDGSIRVGGLEWTPTIQIGEQYNNNIFEQETTDVKSGDISTIDPSLTVSATHGVNVYSLSYRLSKGIYSSSHGDDYLDHFFNADANLGFTKRMNVILHLAYNRTHNTRGSIFSGLPLLYNSPYRYHETIGNISVAYGVNAIITFTGEYSNKHYDNHFARTMPLNYDTMGSTAIFSYPIGSKTRAVLEARYKRFNHNYFSSSINLDSSDQSYYVGLDWNASAKTTGSARIGYLKKKFFQPGLPGFSGMSWELNMEWNPMPNSTWTLKTSSAPLESSGYGTFSVSDGVKLTWNHQWSERLSHKASVGYDVNRIYGKVYGIVIGRRDRVSTAKLSVDYQLQDWLTVEPAYNYTVRHSNVANASFKQNIWSLNLIAML